MKRGIIWLFAGNFISKFIGLAREVLFAAWFGTGNVAAAFRVAQTAYLLPTQTLVGDTLSAGLLPLYRHYKEENIDRARVLILIAVLYGLVFSAVVTTSLYIFSFQLATFIAPGLDQNIRLMAAGLIKILALSTPFFVLSGILGYAESASGRFSAIASRPILLNIGSIAGAGLAVYTHSDPWLAIGLTAAHISIFGWAFFAYRSFDGLSINQRVSRDDVRYIAARFARTMIVLIGLPIAAQVNVVVERIISSWIGDRVIPSVDYARFIVDTVVMLIAAPMGIFTLSSHGGGRSEQVITHIRKSVAILLLLSFPLSAYLAINAEPVVIVLFARGSFNQQSINITTDILRWMGASLGATTTAYYLIRSLNAQLLNKQAMAITTLACLSNMSINLLLWHHYGAQTIGMGVAAYGVVLFSLSLWRSGIGRAVVPMLLRISFVTLIQTVLMVPTSGIRSPMLRLVAAGMVTCICWLLAFWTSTKLRDVATPLLALFPFRRGEART